MRSRAQNRYFRWAASHPAEATHEGLKPGVAQKFIKDSHGEHVRDLPERIEHKADGGAVNTSHPRQFRW
jgi:hypothetical protein